MLDHVEAEQELKLAGSSLEEGDRVGRQLDGEALLHAEGDLSGIALHARRAGKTHFPQRGERIATATTNVEDRRSFVRRQMRIKHAPVEAVQLRLMLRSLRMPAAVVMGVINVHG